MTDREWDKRLHIRTVGREDESCPNYAPYEPTPYAVLRRLADGGYVRRKDHLLDYGCGKGRVAFFMASEVGCRVTGVDYSGKLIEIAKENRRASGLGDRVKLACLLAEWYELTDENVFFFFNPFSGKVFDCVLRRIAGSWHDDPRTLTVICYYPSEEYLQLLEAAPEFEPVASIDCNDLFSGVNARERIVVYRAQKRPPD